jgi:hypothetical protein
MGDPKEQSSDNYGVSLGNYWHAQYTIASRNGRIVRGVRKELEERRATAISLHKGLLYAALCTSAITPWLPQANSIRVRTLLCFGVFVSGSLASLACASYHLTPRIEKAQELIDLYDKIMYQTSAFSNSQKPEKTNFTEKIKWANTIADATIQLSSIFQ